MHREAVAMKILSSYQGMKKGLYGMKECSIGWALMIVGIVLLFYILYINGYMVLNSKRALMYVGAAWGKRASFTSCSGYTKRVIKFEEVRTYYFDLNLELNKGDVTVEILDKEKQCLLSLDQDTPQGSIDVQKGNRYYLVVRFRAASGNYTIDWK